jgi:hypothetical protein
MRRSIAVAISVLSATFLGGFAARPASAFGHLWDITEVYSDGDGTVQFIEMFTNVDLENELSQTFLLSALHQFNFPTDLVGSTANRHLLVATAAFASQPGAVTPDYVMPDSFIRTTGDTLSFWSEGVPPYGFPVQWDVFSFGGSAPSLPTDGVDSLHRAFGSSTIASGPNSPTNFSGQVGSLVPEPGSAWLLGAGLAAVALQRRRMPRSPPLPRNTRPPRVRRLSESARHSRARGGDGWGGSPGARCRGDRSSRAPGRGSQCRREGDGTPRSGSTRRPRPPPSWPRGGS